MKALNLKKPPVPLEPTITSLMIILAIYVLPPNIGKVVAFLSLSFAYYHMRHIFCPPMKTWKSILLFVGMLATMFIILDLIDKGTIR